MKNLISFLLVFGLFIIMTVPAFAENSDYLGTEDDISGEIISEDSKNSNLGRVVTFPVQIGDDALNDYAEIFTITAAGVTNLLPSNVGGKNFNPALLPSCATNIIIRAELYHDCMYGFEETGWYPCIDEWVSAGVCYYGYNPLTNQYQFTSVYKHYFLHSELGILLEFSFEIDEYLEDNVFYYSFIKNEPQIGVVTGTLGLYWE